MVFPIRKISAVIGTGERKRLIRIIGLGDGNFTDCAAEAHASDNILRQLLPAVLRGGAIGETENHFTVTAQLEVHFAVESAMRIKGRVDAEMLEAGERRVRQGGNETSRSRSGVDESLAITKTCEQQPERRNFGSGIENEKRIATRNRGDDVIEEAWRREGRINAEPGAD